MPTLPTLSGWSPPALSPGSSDAPGKTACRILVIDDNRSILDDFRKVLEPSRRDGLTKAEADFFGEVPALALPPEFEVEYAPQGQAGIDLCRRAHAQGRPHAVAFMDVRMPPGIDGIATATELFKISAELQIVICSAYNDYSWETMITKLGHRDRLLILKKPFAGIEVLQLACALGEKWRLAREATRHLRHVEEEVAARTAALVAANEQLETEIEQRRSAEEQLLRSQRLESIGALASGIAHDLNNLLSPILMSAHLLEDESLRPEQQALISLIQTTTERAAKIVAQMLTFARGTADERTVLEADALIWEIAKIAGETFNPNIRVECRSQPELPFILGNPTQLHQVLMNLCVNARDALPGGGKILLDAETFLVDESYVNGRLDALPGEYVRLRVTDTGAGIPEEIRIKIFEPFFTTKPPGKGSGLGLSTAAGIIRNHGGFIEVHGAPGGGTTFCLFLPAEAQRAPAANPPPRPPPPRGNGELILVVDDENGIRETAAATLVRHGYRAVTAGDGAEAMILYAQNPSSFGAVLTDMHMPILDGAAFTRSLQNVTPDVPIVLSTGSINDTLLREFDSLSIFGVLSKPYLSVELLHIMHRALQPPVSVP